MLFDAQPPRVRPRALRTSVVLPLVAVMIWSSGVAWLWTNESRLVFQARRSRYPRPVPREGVIELRTPDGIRLDALSSHTSGCRRTGSCSARPAAVPDRRWRSNWRRGFPRGGLLLLSAIDSVPARGSRLFPWAPVSLLASQRFDSMAKAPRVMVPVLQVHAPNDWLVPIDAARTLFKSFPGRKVMLELPGGHNNVGFADESLSRALGEFWSNPR